MKNRKNVASLYGFNAGFTLVELLVVIAIIALLLSILMPALSKVREQAKLVVCSSHMRSLGQASLCYAGENKGKFPMNGQRTALGGLYGSYSVAPYWDMRLLPYLGAVNVDMQKGAGDPFKGGDNLRAHARVLKIFQCPSAVAYSKTAVNAILAKGWYPRSYKINAYLTGQVVRDDGYFLERKSYYDSYNAANVKRASNTVMLVDTLNDTGSGINTLWGSWVRGWCDVTPAHYVKFDGPTKPQNTWKRPRSFGKSNFVFADYHNETLQVQFTQAQPVAFTDYDDPIDGIKFHPEFKW